MKVPTRKRDQLSLNNDHTHFIIIREQPIGSNANTNSGRKSTTTDTGEKQLEKLTDSAESATNRFRDRFEDFLHQETLQQQPAIPVSTSPVSSPTTTTNGRKDILLEKIEMIDF